MEPRGEVIHLEDVSKKYHLASGDVCALNGITLSVNEGDFIAIMGKSGSGKSTLLNQLGILDVPTEGNLYIMGKNTRDMSDRELTIIRRDTIGYIFQKFNLIPLLTAFENVEYPYILKYRHRDNSGMVTSLLKEVDIDEALAQHRPAELSGGQQQRIAIARALVNDPKILLCDEPTGNLDTATGTQIMELLRKLNEQGRTVILVTHDPNTAKYADRIITIQDGRIVS